MDKKSLCFVALVAVALAAYVGNGHAASRFSNRSLKGTYGFAGSGTLVGGTVQAAVVGLNSFDRAGGCRITARINAFGAVTPVSSTSCSYSVNPDGTGSLKVIFDVPLLAGPFTSDFVIVDNANEIRFVLSDPTGLTVATGVSKRVAAEDE